MKRLSLFLLLLSVLSAFAQQEHEQTNAGTDFWVTSFHNIYDQTFPESFGDDIAVLDSTLLQTALPDSFLDTATVQVVGLEACSGWMENPATGWHVSFEVTPGQVTQIVIPEEQICCYRVSGIQSKGIHIHTECECWAYLITNRQHGEHQGNMKIQLAPVHAYDEIYFLPDARDYIYAYSYTTYYLVATEDDTHIIVDAHHQFNGFAESFENERYSLAEHHPQNEYLLNAGDVLVISGIVPDSVWENHSSVRVQTNCKPVAVYYSYSRFLTFNDFAYTNHSYVEEFFDKYVPKADGSAYVFVSHNEALGWIPKCFAADFENAVIGTNNPNFQYMDLGEHYGFLIYSYGENICALLFPDYHPIITQWHTNFAEVGADIFMNGAGLNAPHAPADRMVGEVIFPTIRDTIAEVNRADLTIVVTPSGISSTYLNGTLIPASDFSTLPEIADRFYVARLAYFGDSIPSLFHLTNPNGFAAELFEDGFDMDQTSHYVNLIGSGCTYDQTFANTESDTLHSCIGDTLRLTTHLDCGSHAPLIWTVNGTEYAQDELWLPIEAEDTLSVILVQNNLCSPDTTYRVIIAGGAPHLSLPADTLVCRGAPITAHSDMFGFFHWSNGTADSTFIPTEEGEYSVRIDNDCGSDSATINVRFYDDPLSVDFGDDTLLCRLATLLLDATQQHPASYLWHDNSTNTTYTVIDDGQYWVVVTDDCEGVSDTINVTYLYDFQVNLGNDTTICSEQPFTLDATTPYSHYLWNDGTTSATHEVTTSGTYSVHVYNACAAADASVTIEVEECDALFFAPSAFTPNGDGLNDAWRPIFNHPERLEKYELRIFDRWGRLLFSTDNPYQGWSGDDLPVGVYAWMMEYQGSGEGSKIVTGSVTLVR